MFKECRHLLGRLYALGGNVDAANQDVLARQQSEQLNRHARSRTFD